MKNTLFYERIRIGAKHAAPNGYRMPPRIERPKIFGNVCWRGIANANRIQNFVDELFVKFLGEFDTARHANCDRGRPRAFLDDLELEFGLKEFAFVEQ